MTCCFLGHRNIEDAKELEVKLFELIEELIVNKNIDTFLFGSKSEFNSLCYDVVDGIKKKHPHIKRVFVRAEYPYISENYRSYLLKSFEDTYYPEHMTDAGRAAYVERNRELIDKSDICIFYYTHDYTPTKKRKSGTLLAYDYALRKNKRIINIASTY